MAACRRPFAPPACPREFELPVTAWNLLGGMDWNGVEWVAHYLGIDDTDQLILDLLTIRDNQKA